MQKEAFSHWAPRVRSCSGLFSGSFSFSWFQSTRGGAAAWGLGVSRRAVGLEATCLLRSLCRFYWQRLSWIACVIISSDSSNPGQLVQLRSPHLVHYKRELLQPLHSRGYWWIQKHNKPLWDPCFKAISLTGSNFILNCLLGDWMPDGSWAFSKLQPRNVSFLKQGQRNQEARSRRFRFSCQFSCQS